MSNARTNILQRLRKNPASFNRPDNTEIKIPDWSQDEKIKRFCERITAVHGEVHRLPNSVLDDWLQQELTQRNLLKVLLGKTTTGRHLAKTLKGLETTYYQSEQPGFRQRLFNEIDVAITDCKAGIAETGSLVLWPDANEPRLMSLVPPVHIALLQADTMVNTFAQLIEQQNWQQQMPTNALLISGPSKTADIEQTLAYGIHGPKQLIVLILE